MARLRLYALTTVGGLCLVYELITEAMSPQGPSLSDLVWILIVIPMYAVGAWLTWRLPTHPQPVRLLVSGTAFVASGAFGSLLASQPQLINSPWSPVLSTLSLEAQAVASLAMALLIGSYPDGFVERSWQRLALRCSWVVLLGPPLALLASPVVPVSPCVADGPRCPQPVRGELARLAGAAGPLAGSEQLVGRCRRRAGLVCTLCRGRCRRPGSDASPVRCRRRRD